MKLARIIRLDESDSHVFALPAESGEWAISGGFEFSDWTEDDLHGKARQAFANGWLGLESFGRGTFVAVARLDAAEMSRLEGALAGHFVSHYGAPDMQAALPVAREELRQMADLCADLDENTLLCVSRSLTGSGVRERFRIIESPEATLEQIAVHAPYEPPPEEG